VRRRRATVIVDPVVLDSRHLRASRARNQERSGDPEDDAYTVRLRRVSEVGCFDQFLMYSQRQRT
jgi:hypothetical protein